MSKETGPARIGTFYVKEFQVARTSCELHIRKRPPRLPCPVPHSAHRVYRGVLGRIECEGHTDTSDFTVGVSGNPVHLTTQFQAVVDRTGGNTWLQPVNAQFGHSSVTAQGSVTGTKGVKGKTVSLDVTASSARLEDMLLLGVKGKKPTMSGVVSFHTKLVIPRGDVTIAQKLQLDGSFGVDSAPIFEVEHPGEGE